MYYKNGKLWLESNYKYGQLFNEKEYDEKGNLITERNYPIEEGNKKGK
jgi:antitoxin component YwqK of YwqJK toxin-antitoxin module